MKTLYRTGISGSLTLSLPFRRAALRSGAAILFGLLFGTAHARADVVAEWNEIADTVVVANAKRPAGAALVDMAYVHAAIYDAVNSIDRRYTPYAATALNAPRGASVEAAAAAAAFSVLRALFPDQGPLLETKYEKSLARIPDSTAKSQGIAVGFEVAERLMEFRADDGRDATVWFLGKTGPGRWQPTPPLYGEPVTPWMARMRPFIIKSPSQFRAPGPPARASDEWVRDYRETKLYGSADSTARTTAQTEIGRFYAEHSAAQYNRIFREFAASQNLSVADNARLFAMLHLAIADAMIASWDSKYHFAFWRPVTAIRWGETDGNDLTEPDPAWTPLVDTPGHPEYPAAHGALTAAYAEVLRRFFGTKRVRILLSSTVTRSSRSFDNTDELVREIVDARVFGGMHFRRSGPHGAEIGRKVASWMARHYFRPAR
jgi:hypothetical protein